MIAHASCLRSARSKRRTKRGESIECKFVNFEDEISVAYAVDENGNTTLD